MPGGGPPHPPHPPPATAISTRAFIRFILTCCNPPCQLLLLPCSALQLDVKDCKDIYASFDKFTEVEVMEGDNQYDAEKHGKQASRFC